VTLSICCVPVEVVVIIWRCGSELEEGMDMLRNVQMNILLNAFMRRDIDMYYPQGRREMSTHLALAMPITQHRSPHQE
jgi:hypothetical protein